jgi:hypothetical protein
MKHVLMATALVEVGAGVALSCCPSATAVLLLGSPLETPASNALGRVAGAALLALAVASWLARKDGRSRAARALVIGMVLYNLGTVVVLGAHGLGSAQGGIALWPAVVLHAAMAAWCVAAAAARPHETFVP